MTKKRNLAVVYLITMIITFVLLGGTAYIIYQRFFLSVEKIPAQEQADDIAIYTPDVLENQTILCVLDFGNKINENSFLIIRFLPTEGKVICVPLSGEIFSQIETKKSTIHEFYQSGGIIQGIKAIENAVNIPIERYIKLKSDGFSNVVDTFGGVQFNVPFDISYQNPETREMTHLYSGMQILDGIQLRQFLTFPEFPGGEEYRAKLVGNTITAMLNGLTGKGLIASLDSTFKTVINSSDSNITAYDFELRLGAISHILEYESEPVQFIVPLGEYTSDGKFAIKRVFKDDLAATFGVKPKTILY